MEREDDEALIAAWRAGDTEAGSALFDRHYDSVARFFHNKIDHAADDLIQRTFLACVEGRDRFEGRSTFRTYLFAVARNVLRRHLRTKRRHGTATDLDHATMADLAPSASTALGRTREQRRLLAALRRVPVDVQILLELHYWERLSSAEIAAIFEIVPATAKTRLRRGRLLLAEVFEKLEGEPSAIRTTTDDLDRWAAEIRSLFGAAAGNPPPS